MCTLGTIKTKSTIRTAGKSLGIDDAIINFIVSLVPNERGQDWTLSQCVYGDDEHAPIKQFATQMATYPELWNVAKRIEGLISNLSVHASGVLILNGKITDHNSIMKTSRKVIVTAWDLHDSEQMGALKYDFLTVKALDKIRTCLNLLMEDHHIEWQGSLRATYDKYLLPANIDYKSPEMWQMACDGHINELFQFDTPMGSKAVRVIQPASLADLAAGNSVMRLMSEGKEQPLDIFARNKLRPKLWRDEMTKYGLNQHEQDLLAKYLEPVYGVMNSQEDMMLTVMDPEISGFSVKEANKLRKAVAKKKKDMIDECHDLFFNKGEELGTRKELLDYVWDVEIARELGYSFSQLHTVAYSTIALQELNLNYYYPPIYWGCACLSVNANAVNEGDYEYLIDEDILDDTDDDDESDEESKKTGKVSYDKVAEAISKFTDFKIVPPDINKSKMGFMPDLKENNIKFGLKGISRIGDDLIDEIIARRPYENLADFIQKMNGGEGKKLISKDKVINLIKAGCFDEIEGKPRTEIMNDFIGMLVQKHVTLDLRNYLMLIEKDLLPHELDKEKGIFLFTRAAHKNKDGNGFYDLDDVMVQWYRKWMNDEPLCVDGVYKVNAAKWDSIYKNGMGASRKFIASNKADLIEKCYQMDWQEEYDKYAKGDVLQWELDSLNFYHSGHPLTNIQVPFEYDKIDELEENKFDGYWNINGEMIPKMHLYQIMGTVLIKNKKESSIILSTPQGVIKVKCYKPQFAKYDKVLDDEEGNEIQGSFFDKGVHLKVIGILRDQTFIPKVYKNMKTDPIVRVVLDEDNKFVKLEDKL